MVYDVTMPRPNRTPMFGVAVVAVATTSPLFAEEPPTDPPPPPMEMAPASTGTVAPPTRPVAATGSDAGRMEHLKTLLDDYRARELHTRFSFWSGQQLYRGEREAELGYFGGGSDEIFAGSPRALDSMSTFQTLRIAGTTAYVVGLGLLVTDLVLLSTRSDSVVGRNAQGEVDSVKPLSWALLVSGGVLGVGGGIAMQGANSYLSDAVEQYNADLASRLKSTASSRIRTVTVGFRSSF